MNSNKYIIHVNEFYNLKLTDIFFLCIIKLIIESGYLILDGEIVMKLTNVVEFIKKYIVLILILVVFVGIVVIIFFSRNNLLNTPKTNIELYENLDFELNSEVYLLSLIKKVSNGELITDNVKIDTSVLGEKELKIKYINEKDEENEYAFKINVVDTTKPVIKYKKELTTTIGNKIDLLKDVVATDNSGEKISVEVNGEYNFNKVGKYTLKYIATDSSGNKTEEEFVLDIVKASIKNKGYYAYSSSSISGGFQFNSDGTFIYSYQFCKLGDPCGGGLQKGVYEIKGNKILAKITISYDDMGNPKSSNSNIEFNIVNENKLTSNGNTLNYRTELN